MLWILVFVSIDEILIGLNILNVIFDGEKPVILFYTCYCLAYVVFLVGMESIFWFVSFKYWETSRQIYRVIRIMENRALLSEKPVV